MLSVPVLATAWNAAYPSPDTLCRMMQARSVENSPAPAAFLWTHGCRGMSSHSAPTAQAARPSGRLAHTPRMLRANLTLPVGARASYHRSREGQGRGTGCLLDALPSMPHPAHVAQCAAHHLPAVQGAMRARTSIVDGRGSPPRPAWSSLETVMVDAELLPSTQDRFGRAYFNQLHQRVAVGHTRFGFQDGLISVDQLDHTWVLPAPHAHTVIDVAADAADVET